MIEIRNISKSFSGRSILSNVSTVFEKGHINLVIGGSGSGKTVMMKCMVGLEEVDSGEIVYDGHIFPDSAKGAEALSSGYRHGLPGRSLVRFADGGTKCHVPLNMFTDQTLEEKRERVQFCLNRVNLPQASKLTPSELSGGMKSA